MTRILILALIACVTLTFAIAAQSSTLSDLSRDLAGIAKQASPAAVQIDAERNVPGDAALDATDLNGLLRMAQAVTKSVGSGFVIDPSGYILTSADVVSNAKTFTVRFDDGATLSGKLAGIDRVLNCALIKVEKTGLKALSLGDSDSLQPGMLVVTINSQAGMPNSVSLGVVAATERQIAFSAGRVLQISGTVGPGSSGGAVLDTEGRVVGMTFAMFSPTSRAAPFNFPNIFLAPSSTSRGAREGAATDEALKALKDMQSAMGVSGIEISPDEAMRVASAARDMASSTVDISRTSGSSGFAIPINRIKPIIEQLKSGKPIEHAMLGMRLIPTDQGIAVKPTTGSPADNAGVKEGDILVSVDGRKFESAPPLTAYITNLKPGDKVNLVVRRDGKEIPITAIAGSQADGPAMFAAADRAAVKPQAKGMFSLSLNDAGIAEVAKSISTASGKSVVVLNPESIKGKVTVHLQSATLESALSVICDTLGCKWTKNGDGYVIKPAK